MAGELSMASVGLLFGIFVLVCWIKFTQTTEIFHHFCQIIGIMVTGKGMNLYYSALEERMPIFLKRPLKLEYIYSVCSLEG